MIFGYIVLRINSINREYPEGIIIDLHTFIDRLDFAESLLIEGINCLELRCKYCKLFSGVKTPI